MNKNIYPLICLLCISLAQAVSSDPVIGLNAQLRPFFNDIDAKAVPKANCKGQAYPYGKKVFVTYAHISNMTKNELLNKMSFTYENALALWRISEKVMGEYNVINYELTLSKKFNYILSIKNLNNKSLVCSMVYSTYLPSKTD